MSGIKIYNVGLNGITLSKLSNSLILSENGLLLHLDPSNSNSYSGSGNLWYDVSSYQNNATLVNGVTFNNNYLIFDGDDDYAEFGTIPVNDELQLANSFTISFWINWDGTGDNYQRIYDKSTGQSALDGYAILIENVSTTKKLTFYSNGGASPVLTSTQSIPVNQWVEYTIVFNSNINAMSLYRNGVLETSAGFSGNVNAEAGLRIGTWYTTGREYRGDFGSTYVYNRALSSAEVKDNYDLYSGTYQ